MLLCLSMAGIAFAQAPQPLKLWYDHPASRWVEALPIGNGRLGAMVYGDPSHETIQLNEGTIWAGGPGNNINPEVKNIIPRVRKLLVDKQYIAAQELADSKVASDGDNGMPYEPAGNLSIQFPDHENISHYYRDLDIERAVTTTTYRCEGTRFSEQVFASFADQVIIVRLTADKPGKINCILSLNSLLQHTVNTRNGRLILNGISGDHEGKKGEIKYATIVQPRITGGTVTANDTSLIIRHANTADIYISIATNYKNYRDISGHPEEKAAAYLSSAIKKPYRQALSDHISRYKKYFDRVQLDLGTTDSIKNPTDIRLEQFHEDNDPQLAALYFQYGRYLLISCSQPGGQPATLQGIWNDKLLPPWDSKYTININTEMNYWPADKTDLPEMIRPLMSMVKDLSVTGRQSAEQMYGARGWVAHHNTDLWRISGVVDRAFSGLWPDGGAWLCENLWEHYLYTGDEDFLRQLYPVLKGAAEYFVDELQTEPVHHWLVVSPSISPEHDYLDSAKVHVSVTAGATMDNQLVFDLFSHTIRAAEILGLDRKFTDTLQMKRDSLPPMQIGRYAQLQEWIEDWDKTDDHHRHVSHLYGLFPGNQISPYRNPELFEAAKNSLVYRGDVSTGWSMAWKINLWARLLDGNHAYKLIRDQLTSAITKDGERGGNYPNLFDAHPPFQIDGNFGCTSGITEMLLQSADGDIFILPAIPDDWKTGSVKGLMARGGFKVDMQWEEGKLTSVIIHSKLGGNCRIRTYDPLAAKGEFTLQPAAGNNANPFFETPVIKQPLISPDARLEKLSLRQTYLYDMKTEKGKSYTLIAR